MTDRYTFCIMATIGVRHRSDFGEVRGIMVKKKKAGVDGVVDVPGGPIRRTNRFFIALKSYGECDENDKVVLGLECSTKKLIAPADRPLALVSWLIDQLIPAMSYSSDEALAKDLEAFRKYVDGLQVG